MDEDLVKTKLESFLRCISRIQDKTPEKLETLESDIDIQDIISVNLERAIQVSVDLAGHLCCDFLESPKTMGEGFLILAKHKIISEDLAKKMVKAVDFRNIAVHQYQSVSWSVVYSICTKGIQDLQDFASAIAQLQSL